ncbi:aldehyde dehydrogenase family protein [Rhizobiales bacterium L72]|uniref:Aldehyde dehydrogenase family protein n=2 Tax=Propylenella binzhouense TaxID=2555902 RepID=A0A964T3B0_9HYPH|nr:aldehyde dehydrogenase family protein [Propylenella binzhouense]
MLIGGEWRYGRSEYGIRDPYRGDVVSIVPESDADDLDAALAAAGAAKAQAAAMPGYERAALLDRVGVLLAERAGEIAEIMTRETGKALKDSRAEIARSRDTIRLSAEEAVRIQGEHVPLDATAMGAGKIAMLLRFPVGIVAGITPFNAPFNLAAHKVAPALASGNVLVLKPPPQAALVVHKLVELFVDAGLPPGFLNVVYGNTVGPLLVRDPRVDFITFTGSTKVGAEIKAASGLRRVALELGGTGQTIVHSDADIAEAAPVCARNAMRLAGQSCASVQNVYVHESLYDRFVERMADEVRGLRIGDPLEPETDVGTLIDENAAKRVESWVSEAVARGAKLLAGGGRRGAQVEPTLLVDVEPSMQVVCNEVFGPVASVQRYSDIEDMFRLVSEAPLGLQCGIYTRSLEIALQAARRIRSGAIIINGTSTWRTDQLPYGGVKNSGIGREGPHYAIREMTEERLVVFNL